MEPPLVTLTPPSSFDHRRSQCFLLLHRRLLRGLKSVNLDLHRSQGFNDLLHLDLLLHHRPLEFDKMFPSEDTDLVCQNYNTESISVNVESSSAQTPLRVSPNDVETSSAVPNNATPSSSKPPIVLSSTAESTYTFGVEDEEEVLN
ncbi:isocitrate dehydrogenase (NADP(+)) [Corchorus olitorius]|uniref:Isocitrate dehydrogenase (NADP(+)) n=1 Tax=Corchorus olitorius TaxID=93759 RepID=A0A1R3GXT5_9ROSI|nr:isocitrate dehydrogenase (NADP(+)) [Corchorus olitorius]